MVKQGNDYFIHVGSASEDGVLTMLNEAPLNVRFPDVGADALLLPYSMQHTNTYKNIASKKLS